MRLAPVWENEPTNDEFFDLEALPMTTTARQEPNRPATRGGRPRGVRRGACRLAALAALCLPALAARATTSPETRDHRAVARELVKLTTPLLQRSADVWIQKKTCMSCHHQVLGTLATRAADEKGLPINAGLEAKQVAAIRRSLDRSYGELLQNEPPSRFGAAYGLLGMLLGDQPLDPLARSLVHGMTKLQQRDGSYPAQSHRPPLEDATSSGTALLIQALRAYGWTEGHVRARERATAWLADHRSRDTEALAFQLLGLYWAEQPATGLEPLAQRLLSQQLDTGGWAQYPERQSDAYATGLALSVLLQVEQLRWDDPRTKRAVEYLDRTFDRTAGAWQVPTRRRVGGLPYFESGYPFGEDQFISYAGTAWATIALTMVSEPGPLTALAPAPRMPTAAADVASRDGQAGSLTPLLEAALWKSDEEFASILAEADREAIEAPGPQGLSLLHAAAADPAKLGRVLELEVGVGDRSELGKTALHLAVATPSATAPRDGAALAARLLLQAGAPVDSQDSTRERPLHAAVASGNLAAARILLEQGADPSRPAAGEDGATPLALAVALHDLEMVELLLSAGASAADGFAAIGSNALHEAVFSGAVEILERLLATEHALAAVDSLDVDGYTPLHYALLQYFGDPEPIRLLLAAGADPHRPSADGVSALRLVEREGYPDALALFASAQQEAEVRPGDTTEGR
ncbi:MAG: hypothetical protein DWQ36_03090 [Acidobacteria bacterium]|nr:MAG: hypothetical protein DWQ36_03090 [Acidobacteriota bacterium]